MTGEQYEVVVTGPAEATPAAEARLGAMLARTHGLPAAGVARALGQKNLRVGEGLSREAAEALVRQLQSMGALTAMRRSTVAMSAVQPVPTPVHGFPATGAPAAQTLQGVGAVPSSAASSAGRGQGLGPLAWGSPGMPSPMPQPSASPGLRPLGASRGDSGAALPAPVASEHARIPTGLGMDIPSAISSFALPETPSPPRDPGNPFSVPEEGEQALELDVKPKEPVVYSRNPHTIAGASALNTNKITATSSVSGLRTTNDEAREDTIRCPTHGLLYDSRKHAGCRRCLEIKRSAARGEDAPGQRAAASGARRGTWASNLSPAKRAFMGLALALFIGFAPAAFYTLGPVNSGVLRLRAEQTALSARPGTEDNLARFDQIEADVDRARSRGLRNTLMLWVGATGLLLAGWYRATA